MAVIIKMTVQEFNDLQSCDLTTADWHTCSYCSALAPSESSGTEGTRYRCLVCRHTFIVSPEFPFIPVGPSDT